MKKTKPMGKSSLATVRRYFPKVEYVEDGLKPIAIEVSHQDASSQDAKNPLICAFARACQRAFTADGVIIGLTISYIIRGKKAIRYSNPESVSREIVSFDRKAGFAEGVYQLSAIAPASRFGVAVHRGGNKSSKPTPRHRHVTTNVRVLT